MTNEKIKVLMYADSPSVATGFATVSRNICDILYSTGRYEIEILGINHYGDPHKLPYDIWPVFHGNDPYGREKVCSMIPNMHFDILFFLQDTFILDFVPGLLQNLKARSKKYRSVAYYPIDGVPKPQWIRNVEPVDYLVTYTEFAKRMSNEVCPNNKHRDKIITIPHGVNTRDFFPIDDKIIEKFRVQYFGQNSEKFVFLNVNRNQQRKDIPRTIAAFKQVKEVVGDNALLYCHMAIKDQGWDLSEVCKSYGLDIRKDVLFPETFGPNKGYPVHVLNLIYNASDCLVSTSLGEGFGLSNLEAMATKTPVIAPNNTAMSEYISEDIGYLVKSGTDPNLYTVLPRDNEVIRPLVDVNDLTEKMLHVMNNRDEANEKAEAAYRVASRDYDWRGKIADSWLNVFDEAYKDLMTGKDTTGSISAEVL